MTDCSSGSPKPRAFVAESSDRHDMRGVAEFGELLPLCGAREIHPMQLDSLWAAFETRLRESGFDPDADFIVHTGHSILVSVLLCVAVHVWGSARVLVFDARTSRYRERRLCPSKRVGASG